MSSLSEKIFNYQHMPKIQYFNLNGEKYKINSKLTIFDLVNYFNYNTSVILLEYNNLICNKKTWNEIFIKNKDKIEIVSIVGGG
jgi:thiamine biosynthesis protein ThiS